MERGTLPLLGPCGHDESLEGRCSAAVLIFLLLPQESRARLIMLVFHALAFVIEMEMSMSAISMRGFRIGAACLC